MSEEQKLPPSVDPFMADDPEAVERERRRLQRQARRQQRSSGRKSLSERVSGVIDGAADRGREALEQTKDRARNRDASPDAPEPPSFRRPRPEPAALDGDPVERYADAASEAPEPAAAASVAPPSAASPVSDPPAADPPAADPPAAVDGDTASARRFSADELMPRRRSRRSPEPAPAAPITEDHDWFADADGAPPPPIPPQRREVATGDYPPLPPPTTPPGRDKTVLFRRLIALALVLLVALAVYGLLTRGGGDSAPAPKGPATLKTESVTIPEGYTRSQIADVAKDAGLSGDYEKATAKAPKGFDIAKTGAPKDASLEGFLFPATYELEKGASVDTLVKDQLSAFDDNISQVNLKDAEKKNLTMYDVVTIASMIEREVLVPKERPLVAAVIYNRLAQGIPLGIDATLRYDLDNFDEPLTESDLQTDSPYNTRLVTGLPPTPIANPGLDSLKAAADPAKVDYLYYVVKPGTCGKHFFTNDYDEFLAASDKYNSAREAEGGSPTDC
ncbi:MAG: endolytic transglycosylase MltG [Solirubrobacterales bacterium]